MRTFAACLIVGLSITSAFAEGSPIASTWLDQVTRSGTDAPEPYGSVKQVNQVTIGSHAVVLEETSMDEIAQALGGSVQHWSEAGEAVSWACFSRDAETLWLYSDGEMGEGKVTGVAIDVRDKAPDTAACSDWPADVAVDLGIMGIGLPTAAIQPNYMTGEPDDYGWFSAVTLTPGATDQVWQELTFRQNADGVVDAVAVLQQTGY
jgi:hypothetical protein